MPLTCEPAGFGQQEGAPGHEEEEGGLQQREAVQLGELGDVGVALKTQHGSQLQRAFSPNKLQTRQASEKKKGYESSDDSCGCAHHEGAAENTQENPHRLEKGGGIEHVRVCPSGLIGHNRPER